jgi:MscS family membrane protein
MFVLAATPMIAFLALVQINMRWGAASAIELALTAVMFLSGAWLSWRAAPVIAEAIISSPRIAPESVDAYLIRISMRLLALAGVASLLSIGAERLGAPVYGIVAGLGVGGLAIALAAQPKVENLIGSLSLFADKPIRVGDFCKYGDDVGTVEAIGIRSTRIRGVDRTLTTVPDGALSKMPIVNFAQRDRMLMKTRIAAVLVALLPAIGCSGGLGPRALKFSRNQYNMAVQLSLEITGDDRSNALRRALGSASLRIAD